MRFILSTGSLYNLDVDTCMTLAAATGFAGIELVVDWRWETHRLSHLERLVGRHNLPILAIHSPFLNFAIPGWPAQPIDRIKQSVGLAEAIGAGTVVVHPPARWLRLQLGLAAPHRSYQFSLPLPLAGPGSLGRWLQHDLPAYQATTAVKIAVENMPCRPLGPLKLEPHHFHRPDQLRQFQYLTLDTTHLATRRSDLFDFYEQVKARVVHLHLSNYNGREHQLPAEGELPLAAFLQRLAADHYPGLISLELNTVSLQAEDELALRQNLRASLLFCQAALGPEGFSDVP
jgi:sugar phosphate isomerase/epimerase